MKIQNLVDIPIYNESTTRSKFRNPVTWKRTKRNNSKGNLTGGSGAKAKKRQLLEEDELQGIKKQREVQLEHYRVLESNEAVVGDVQPHLGL